MTSEVRPEGNCAVSSTYRLQITADFTLHDAAGIVDYLADLGVGAVYCSPLLQSIDGSNYGYDVSDVHTVDLPRGGESGWQALVAAARAHGLEIVVDIVPNHLGVEDAGRARTTSSASSCSDADAPFPERSGCAIVTVPTHRNRGGVRLQSARRHKVAFELEEPCDPSPPSAFTMASANERRGPHRARAPRQFDI